MLKIYGLKCAGMKNPLGITLQRPRFSWILSSDRRAVRQEKYRLVVYETEDITKDAGTVFFDSGEVESGENQVYLPRLFTKSGRRYYWKVFCWDNHGQEAESTEEAWFEMGLMMANNWMARWIEPPQKPAVSNMDTFFQRLSGTMGVEEHKDGEQLVDEKITFPCPMLRKEFSVKAKVARARIYATAHGLYELELNGKRVGDYELAPECTCYQKYLQVQTYDVTELLQEGENAIGATLANGWWASQIGLNGTSAQYGDKLALLMQLQIRYEDGTEDIIGTDETFCGSYGPLRYSELYLGEKYDANYEVKGWSEPGFDAAGWEPSQGCNYGYKNLVGQNAGHIAVLRTLQDVKLYRSPKNELIIDCKQVLAGNMAMHIKGEPGAEILLDYSEETDKDGNFWFGAIGTGNGHQDIFVLDGTGEGDYCPRFTYYGFRYVRVSSSKGDVELSNITARLIGSRLDITGEVTCSNPLVNKLQENIRWTMLSNIPSMLTDNPDRERAGWTGDCEMVAPAVCSNLDVQAFFERWIREMALEQEMNGEVPIIIPSWMDYEVMSKFIFASPAGWGDASTILPWLMYERYGDKTILLESYDMMKKWVAYETDKAEASNPPELGDLSADRAERQKHLWNTGYQFGDWMVPSGCYNKETGEYQNTAQCLTELVGTYYYAVSVSIVARTARLLGYGADADYYEGLLAEIKDAAVEEIYKTGGILDSEYMGAQIFALHAGLYPEGEKDKVFARLTQQIEEKGFDAGFNSACLLWKILSDNHRTDLAYDFLLNEEFPSWLYGVKQGATTVWEQMQCILPDGERRPLSFVQPAFCSIGDWMIGGMAGIWPKEPGYRTIRIEPAVTKRLDYVNGAYDSVQGRITSSWAWAGDSLTLKAGIPANTRADILLPKAELAQVLEKGLPLEGREGILNAEQVADGVMVSVGSGEYEFVYCMK